MAEKPMHHFGMDGNTNGASSGQFVVTVGADGKVMQATSTKSDVYQYVVNAAGGSGQYMGLMSMGSDGKLTSMRNDRNILPQEASSAAVIDFNSGKDPKTVLLQIHHAQPHIIHHANPETHSLKPQQQIKHRDEDHQHRNDHNSIPLQPSAVIDFNAKDPKAVLLQIHPSQSQLPHQSVQENQSTHHQQVSQQRLQQSNITQQQPQQLQTSLPDQQQQLQSHDHRHSLQQQHRRQSHQQVLRTDKIVKGDREVVCAKSCRACCKFDDDEEAPDVNAYVQQSMKEGNPSPTTTAWTAENSTTFSSPGLNSTSPNGPSKAARFQCKVCLKMFTQKVNLTAHERIHFGERPYQCKTCLKSFTQQSNLVTHERIHTGERPYQCNVCMKRFTQRQNLTAHERIHLGERPFTCQVCQKSFTQSQNLTAHERIHLGERPFQCKVCLKTFTQQQNLNSHERIHHMERQFTCNVCLRSFIQESSLQRHMQTHTGERPYTCQVCHRSFAQQSSLLVHEWVHKTPDRRKRNFAFEAVEEHVLEISSEQGHPNTDGEQKRIDQEDINDDKGQVQCLT